MKTGFGVVVSLLLVAGVGVVPTPAHADPPDQPRNLRDPVGSALAVQQLNHARLSRLEGDRLSKAKSYDKALEAYNESLLYNQTDSDTYAGLADVYAGKGNYREAIAYYRMAVGDIPERGWVCSRENDGDLQMRFALLLSRLGRYEQALALYQAGHGFFTYSDKEALTLTMTPQTFDKALFESTAHAALSFYYTWQSRTEEALPHVTEAVRLAPKSAAAHYYLGFYYKLADHSDESRAEYTKAMELGRGIVRQKAAEKLGIRLTSKPK